MVAKSNPPILRRFKGSAGKPRLLESLRQQRLVAGDLVLAKALLKCASISGLSEGQELLAQGDAENDIYFILSGEFSIRVNDREIATREAGNHVGEMALVDSTSTRSATARAKTSAVVAHVKEQSFEEIANKNPQLWRRMAVELAARLRQRNRFHVPPRVVPAVFIGSSSEGLEVATCIHSSMLRRPVVPRLWSQGVFQLSSTTIEDLMKMSRESDFSIIVMTADDITNSRGKKKASPRDNIIFELGLFMGAISRERTYIVAPLGVDLKIPTDLLGVTLVRYKLEKGKSLARCLQPVAKQVFQSIAKVGPL